MKQSTNNTMLNDNLFQSKIYHFTNELKDAVKVAFFLGKPLLVTGNPGTGKTQLAYAIAEILNKMESSENNPSFAGEPLHFNTKSISTFTDVLYDYDQIRHFRNTKISSKEEGKSDVKKYIHWRPIGQAILASRGEEDFDKKRYVILMDEIDKAPRDFPNDLLDVMESYEMEVPELNWLKSNEMIKTCDKNYRPFIVLSSNSEKSLPDAFLRRCVFFYINLPEGETLLKILEKHSDIQLSESEQKNARDWFFSLSSRKQPFRKEPSTAEFIDWLRFLSKTSPKFPFEKLSAEKIVFSDRESEIKKNFRMSFTLIAKNKDDYMRLLKDYGFDFNGK